MLWISRVLMKFYYVTNISYLHIFVKETTTFLKFFEICTEMNIVSLFFLNEGNIATSLLMIHLKCAVVHYTNLNSSSTNELFLNCGPLNMSFHFFRFLVYVYLNEVFVKTFMRKLSFFNASFQTSFKEVAHYRILGCQIL